MHLDLSSLASVRDTAREIRDRFGKIDVLLNNAGRVINVGSDAHLHGKIDFDNFLMEKRYTGFKAYAASRLATALFTRSSDGRPRAQGTYEVFSNDA